jgi:hypothetical protein
MQEELIETEKGRLALYRLKAGSIAAVSDLLDLIVNCPTDTLFIEKDALTKGFYELQTCIAGEFVQKGLMSLTKTVNVRK